jgi:hypothetical protein
MGEQRLHNEKKIENENFRLKIGTTNKINPLVVYIEGRTFICPSFEKDDYSKEISEIKRSLSQSISRNIRSSSRFDDKYIMDFQVASSGVAKGKKSFLSFQFLLRQNKDEVLNLKELKEQEIDTINNIVDALKESILTHNFSLSKTKK